MVIDDFLWNLQSSGVVKGGPSAVGWLVGFSIRFIWNKLDCSCIQVYIYIYSV